MVKTASGVLGQVSLFKPIQSFFDVTQL